MCQHVYQHLTIASLAGLHAHIFFGVWYLPQAMLKSDDHTPVVLKGCSLCTICQHNHMFAV